MTTPLPSKGGGIAAPFFLICAVALAGGLALDFSQGPGSRFWTLDQAGMPAALGAGVAAAVVLTAHLVRLLLGRRRRRKDA